MRVSRSIGNGPGRGQAPHAVGKSDAGAVVMALRLRANARLRLTAMVMLHRWPQAASMRIHHHGRRQRRWRELAEAQKNCRRNGQKAPHVLGNARGSSNLTSVTRWHGETHPRESDYLQD